MLPVRQSELAECCITVVREKMKYEQYDVLGLGSITVDFVGTVKSWPQEGDKRPLETFGIHDGGLVGTALVAFARLGGRAAFAGKLGFSDMAKRALCALEKESIDAGDYFTHKLGSLCYFKRANAIRPYEDEEGGFEARPYKIIMGETPMPRILWLIFAACRTYSFIFLSLFWM